MKDLDIIALLDRLSLGLNFDDADDRVIFRIRVCDTFTSAKLSIIRSYIRELNWEWSERTGEVPKGPMRVGQSRSDALRHLANDYILAHQLGEL